jgi:dihydropteroate synthase
MVVDHWKLRTRTLQFGPIPLLMGIVNVTPDSFSDGGQFLDPTAAIAHGLQLAADGADLLDIGGQSTRPGSQSVDADEELRRVMPVLEALRDQTGLPISIDTSKAAVARAALDAGAEVINDVTALTDDIEMLPLAASVGCGICAMHMRGTPQTMQEEPAYEDVVAEVTQYLADRRDAMTAIGIEPNRIALDPGIGFGKTLDHNLALLRHAGDLHTLGCPILIGHSRKRFIADVLDDAETDRTPGTIGVAISLAMQGIQILRVHDVAAVRQAMLLHTATRGEKVVQ